jgi:hypothetical protein
MGSLTEATLDVIENHMGIPNLSGQLEPIGSQKPISSNFSDVYKRSYGGNVASIPLFSIYWRLIWPLRLRLNYFVIEMIQFHL